MQKRGIPGLVFFSLLGVAQISVTLYRQGFSDGVFGLSIGVGAIAYGIFRYFLLNHNRY
jgi:hypothetical protein